MAKAEASVLSDLAWASLRAGFDDDGMVYGAKPAPLLARRPGLDLLIGLRDCDEVHLEAPGSAVDTAGTGEFSSSWSRNDLEAAICSEVTTPRLLSADKEAA